MDQYIACDAIGMSAEAPVVAFKEVDQAEYLGGAAIVAAHVRALGAKCHFISVTGEDLAAERARGLRNRQDRKVTHNCVQVTVELCRVCVARLRTQAVNACHHGPFASTRAGGRGRL